MDEGLGDAIRGEVRTAGHHRVAHGLYRIEAKHLDDETQFRRDLNALRLVLPADAAWTHVTGARLRGWDLPALPEKVPHFAAVRCDNRPRRPGLICSRLTHDSVVDIIGGLPVDAPAEILLRAARDLGDLDLAIMVDSAAHLGDIDEESMAAVLGSGRPGCRRLRRVWSRRDGLAESPGETVLRWFHDVMSIETESQVDVLDDDGHFVCRADLRVVGTMNLHEYDGAVHRKVAVHRRDLRRERRLASTPYVRRGFTLDDLLNHPAVVMHELDRLLGRSHQPRRLRAWRALLGDSLYTSSGRDRIMNRWYRSTTPLDWAETA